MINEYYDFKPEVKPPFRVDSLDQFNFHENDYYVVGYFNDIEDAILSAKNLTEESIKECGSVDNWQDSGSIGLVYDSQGYLVWSYRVECLNDNKGEENGKG